MVKYKPIILWGAAIIWLGLIFYLSSIPSFPVDLTDGGYGFVSSVMHIFLYFILAWLFIAAFQSSGAKPGYAFFGGFALAVIYGITDEWHQSFVVGREAHLSDWLLDAVGAYLILSFYTFRYQQKKKIR